MCHNLVDSDIRFEPFFGKFIPELKDVPMKWNAPQDILRIENDEAF
jgi:hypothetical protein